MDDDRSVYEMFGISRISLNPPPPTAVFPQKSQRLAPRERPPNQHPFCEVRTTPAGVMSCLRLPRAIKSPAFHLRFDNPALLTYDLF